MEVAPQSVSPHIQRVLQRFATSANRTLQGPGGLVLLSPNHGSHEIQMSKLSSDEFRKALAMKTESEVEHVYRSRFPVQQLPVFTPVDSCKSEKIDTLLAGENIACFVVGGEKRLCLPQILNTVLRDYTLQEINSVCDELHIFCSRCQPDQLEILKICGILPPSAPSCGLITKTDAERLCNALIPTPTDSTPSHPSPSSFKVYHECFGKCKGVFCPESYTSQQALCIQCVDHNCLNWFTPQTFVCHSHKALENRTCHWGFDSANWRHYLLLAKHQPAIEKLQDVLEEIKSRFDVSNKYKRKQVSDANGCGGELKRSKSNEDGSSSSAWSETGASSTLRAMMSAFQPWPPGSSLGIKDGKLLPAPPAIMREGFLGTAPSYLHTGPPVLLHPDKVVPHSESSRYEPNYAPNVSLAPNQKFPGEDDDEEEEEPEDKKPVLDTPLPGRSTPSQPISQYKEWELSESDDSSLERASPPQDEECHRSPPSEDTRALEIEMEMIRQALDGKIGNEQAEKERFIREFCKLRTKDRETLQSNLLANKTLAQEMTSMKTLTKERIQEASDKNCVLEQELKKLRRDTETKYLEVQDERAKLKLDVKRLEDRKDAEVSQLIQVNQELQARLTHYELVFEQVRLQNILMHEKLLQLGVNVLDLDKTNCNGSVQLLTSPSQRSPPVSALERGSPTTGPHLGFPGFLGVMQSHAKLDQLVKKEREGCT